VPNFKSTFTRTGESTDEWSGRAHYFVADEMDSFMCPITGEILLDPVVASDGHTYSRAAIAKWFEQNQTSPLTGVPCTPSFQVLFADLVPRRHPLVCHSRCTHPSSRLGRIRLLRLLVACAPSFRVLPGISFRRRRTVALRQRVRTSTQSLAGGISATLVLLFSTLGCHSPLGMGGVTLSSTALLLVWRHSV
jgi:hypothetical protein